MAAVLLLAVAACGASSAVTKPSARPQIEAPLGTNLDFETASSAGGVPDGWSGSGAGYAFALDSTVAHSGHASGRIIGPRVVGSTWTIGALTQCFAVPVSLRGQWLQYQGYLKTWAVSGGSAASFST